MAKAPDIVLFVNKDGHAECVERFQGSLERIANALELIALQMPENGNLNGEFMKLALQRLRAIPFLVKLEAESAE